MFGLFRGLGGGGVDPPIWRDLRGLAPTSVIFSRFRIFLTGGNYPAAIAG